MYSAGDKANRYGQYERAIELLTDALESNHLMDEALSSAYFSRAFAYRSLDEYQAALDDYQSALKAQPSLERDAVFLNARALAYIGLENLDSAMADIQKALTISPGSASLVNTRGVIWRHKGEYAKAEEDHRKALEISPRYWKAKADLAWLKATCPDESFRDGQEAVALAESATKVKPDHTTVDSLAAAYAEVGRYDDAVRAVEMIISVLDKNKREKLMEPLGNRLERYRGHAPWRE